MVQFERTTILLFYSFFILGSNISDAINPNISAADTPTAHEVNPPVNNPKNPCSSIAFFMPFHKTLPNPVRGTVAPAPANLTKGSYIPTAPSTTPVVTRGEYKRVLFVPTGALLSTVSYNEGKSVPGIAHGVILEGKES